MQWYDRPYPEIVYTSNLAWQTIDISSLVPNGTVGLALLIVNEDTYSGNRHMQVRKYGSTDNDLNNDVMEPISQIGYFVGCSADRKVDVYGEPAYVHVYILASFTADEVEFFTNRQDVSGSATYTWDDRDLSAYVPAGSQGAFFNMQGGTSYSNPTGVRKKGSTQDVTAILYSFTGVAVGVDVDRHVEYYRRTTNSKLFLMGYVKQGHGVFKTNPTAISPASGSYQDVDLFYDAPEGAKGVVLRVRTSSTYSRYYDARMDGETEEVYKRNRFYTYHAVRLSNPSINELLIEVKRQGSETSFAAVGYFKDILPSTEERGVDLEIEVAADEYREEGLVEVEAEVSSFVNLEYGVVDVEAEVRSFENLEYGFVDVGVEVKGSTVQYETRQIDVDVEIQEYDKQNYREYREVDADVVVRSVVPWPSPPGLTGRNPAPGETCVRLNQPICLVLYGQNQDQVDLSSISLEVNGFEYKDGDPEFSQTGTPDRYEIQVSLPAWEYEQLVTVVVNAVSAIGVAMDEATYSFTTEWDPVLTRGGMGRVEIYKAGKYDFDILTVQEDWARQGTPRETIGLEMWFGRYLKLPAVQDIEIRVKAGDTNALGKEVLENGYFSIKVGDQDYVRMFEDTVVHLGPMYVNTHKDIRFKLSVPEDAGTKRYILLELEVTPKMMRTWGRFPWGVGIYASDVGLFNFHPNKVFYRAFVFDNAMWKGLEDACIVSSPFYRGEDKQW